MKGKKVTLEVQQTNYRIKASSRNRTDLGSPATMISWDQKRARNTAATTASTCIMWITSVHSAILEQIGGLKSQPLDPNSQMLSALKDRQASSTL